MQLDLNPQFVEMTSMMPRGSSLNMSLPGGGTTPHQDRTTPQDETRMRDSQIGCTKDMRMRGDRNTRIMYRRLVKMAENSPLSHDIFLAKYCQGIFFSKTSMKLGVWYQFQNLKD